MERLSREQSHHCFLERGGFTLPATLSCRLVHCKQLKACKPCQKSVGSFVFEVSRWPSLVLTPLWTSFWKFPWTVTKCSFNTGVGINSRSFINVISHGIMREETTVSYEIVGWWIVQLWSLRKWGFISEIGWNSLYVNAIAWSLFQSQLGLKLNKHPILWCTKTK